MQKVHDHIIIGQGLAGSILAYRLIQAGQSVLVIDNNHLGSSSKVAAGIINPITGYRLTTNSLFAEQQKTSYALYAEFKTLFQQQFLQPLKQYRFLKSAEQVNYWNKRVKHENFIPFTGKHVAKQEPFIENEFGVVEIKQASRVYVPALLEKMQHWLCEQDAYVKQKIDYSEITITENEIELNDIKAQNIIFCEGYQAIHNPWWQHLPFKLSKGEILSVKLNKKINALYNWRQWIFPKNGSNSNTALLGANYEWGDFSDEASLTPTKTARDYLLMRLESNTNLKAELIDQKAGIRPTPTHRFPYIGAHKEHHNIFCFNGFGSKGCVTIPYYSELLVESLVNNKPLPKEVTQWL